jgi:zinc transporter, ZIP family
MRTIGLVMAFGTGVLFSSVAFDLVEDALDTGGGRPTTAGIALGAVTYFVGDTVVSRRGAANRASTMAPEAARQDGPVSGLVTSGGFLLAVMLDYVT